MDYFNEKIKYILKQDLRPTISTISPKQKRLNKYWKKIYGFSEAQKRWHFLDISNCMSNSSTLSPSSRQN